MEMMTKNKKHNRCLELTVEKQQFFTCSNQNWFSCLHTVDR